MGLIKSSIIAKNLTMPINSSLFCQLKKNPKKFPGQKFRFNQMNKRNENFQASKRYNFDQKSQQNLDNQFKLDSEADLQALISGNKQNHRELNRLSRSSQKSLQLQIVIGYIKQFNKQNAKDLQDIINNDIKKQESIIFSKDRAQKFYKLIKFVEATSIAVKNSMNTNLKQEVQKIVKQFCEILPLWIKHENQGVDPKQIAKSYKRLKMIKFFSEDIKIELKNIMTKIARQYLRTVTHQNFEYNLYKSYLENLILSKQIKPSDLQFFQQYLNLISKQLEKGQFSQFLLNNIILLNRHCITQLSQNKQEWVKNQKTYFFDFHLNFQAFQKYIRQTGYPIQIARSIWSTLQIFHFQKETIYQKNSLIKIVPKYLETSKDLQTSFLDQNLKQDDGSMFFSDQNKNLLQPVGANKMISHILPVVMEKINEFNIRDLQVILQGFSEILVNKSEVIPEIEQIIKRIKYHVVSNTKDPSLIGIIISVLRSLKSLRYDEDQFFNIISDTVLSNEFFIRNSQMVTYYVFCTGYLRNRDALQSVLAVLKDPLFKKNINHGRQYQQIFSSLILNNIIDQQIISYAIKGLHQMSDENNRIQINKAYGAVLYYSLISFQQQNKKLAEKLDTQSLKQKLLWVSQQSQRNSSISTVHKILFVRLLQLGFDVETEKELLIDKFKTQTDLFIESSKTVIEIQGPYHYKINKKNQDIGYSHMVRNILRHRGYNVIELGPDMTRALNVRNFSQEKLNQIIDDEFIKQNVPEYEEKLQQYSNSI